MDGAGQVGKFCASARAISSRVAVELGPRGQVIVGRLSVDDKPLALTFGHVVANKFDGYQNGVDLTHEGELRSPGTAAHLSMMMYLTARGGVAYDNLRGHNMFKQEYARSERMISHLIISKPSVRSALYAGADLSRRAIRKLSRKLTQAGAGAPAAAPPKIDAPAEN